MRTILNLNNEWGFYRGNLLGAEKIDFNDQEFANITIPHNMRLEKKHCNGGSEVYQGIGWYRRYFQIDKIHKDSIINIDFEGVMIDSEIYLNGKKIQERNGGYIGFSIDISKEVRFEENNVLAVKVSNYNNPDTPPGKPIINLDFHYYGGIYRNVSLRITNKLHISNALQAEKIASGGVFVTYQKVNKNSAIVNVKTHVMNQDDRSTNCKIFSRLLDKEGNIVAKKDSTTIQIEAFDDQEFTQSITVNNPHLWNPNDPYLYSLISEVYREDNLVDSINTKIGIRNIEFKENGFYINGEKLYLRGVNRHQAFQNVGDAASDSMQWRDAIQIQENGFNAVRATHYPNANSFLDACDEIGLLVIECQPGWQNFSNSQKFYENTLRDTREMISRDRNRPSIILWETSLNETAYSAQWAEEVTAIAHAEYPGNQMYTAADYGLQGSYYDVNYKVVDTNWDRKKENWTDFDPKKPFLTREWGDFEELSKSLRKQNNCESAMITQTLVRQRYLNGDGYSDWGGLDACDRIGGYFLWSFNDYARGSTNETLGSGTVDIDRYEKYCYYWFQSMQVPTNVIYGPMVFIASTYSVTSSLNVSVFSNCDSVRLYQNGKLIQEITREKALKSTINIAKKDGSPIFLFTLKKFVPGELKAEAVFKGEIVTTHIVKTPDKAIKIQIEIRDRGIKPVADGSDLIPVFFKIVDKNGTVVPGYDRVVSIQVMGEGKLVGKGIERIQVEHQKLEGGIGFAFVQTSYVSGTIQIIATSNELTTAVEYISTIPYEGMFVPVGTHKKWMGGIEKLEQLSSPIEMSTDFSEPSDIITNTVIASIEASFECETDRGTDKLRDGVTTMGTGWLSGSLTVPQTITVIFKKPQVVRGSRIYWEKDSNWYLYDLEVSMDGISWKKVLDDHFIGGQHFTPEIFEKQYLNIYYVRVIIKDVIAGGGHKIGMAELILYGHDFIVN